MAQIEELSISEIHEKLTKKELSCQELAEIFLARIDKLNKKLFSYLTVTSESALLQAKGIDKRRGYLADT